MKLLKIIRGGSLFPITCANGDKYDSTGTLYDGQRIVWDSLQLNTDPTKNYKGGRLAGGSYYGIKRQRPNGSLCIFIFSKACDITKVKRFEDIDPKYYELPSDIPNPNHGGKKIMTLVLVHGGKKLIADGSLGCITVLNLGQYPTQFDELMNELEMNEIVDIILVA